MQICDRTFNLTGKVTRSKYMLRIVGPDADTTYSLCTDQFEEFMKWIEAKSAPRPKQKGRGRPRAANPGPA